MRHRRRRPAILMAGAGSWIRPPLRYRALTAAWLPERFRDEFFPGLGPTDEEAADSVARRLPGVYRRLPQAVRFIGPYQEARARMAGRNAGIVARLSNRFWIGEPRLPFAGGDIGSQ